MCLIKYRRQPRGQRKSRHYVLHFLDETARSGCGSSSVRLITLRHVHLPRIHTRARAHAYTVRYIRVQLVAPRESASQKCSAFDASDGERLHVSALFTQAPRFREASPANPSLTVWSPFPPFEMYPSLSIAQFRARLSPPFEFTSVSLDVMRRIIFAIKQVAVLFPWRSMEIGNSAILSLSISAQPTHWTYKLD